MTTYKKITDPKEKEDVGWLTMMAAEAHRVASDSCSSASSSYSDSESYNFFLRVVSFELILVSVEQSLRLLLLLRFSIFPKNPNHNLFDLYERLQDKGAGEEWIIEEIIRKINALVQTKNISPISEEELAACLKEHCFSYSNTKYFQVDRQGKLSGNFGYTKREREILYYFAVALIELNKYWLGMLDLTEEELGTLRFTEGELEVLRKRFLSADT